METQVIAAALISLIVGFFIGRIFPAASPIDESLIFIECPFCLEPVRVGAVICKTCRKSLAHASEKVAT